MAAARQQRIRGHGQHLCCQLLALCLIAQASVTAAYHHYSPKDNYFANLLMSDVLSQMENNMLQTDASAESIYNKLAPMTRTHKTSSSGSNSDQNEDYYQKLYVDSAPNPKIRDQESLQHAPSLWSHQFLTALDDGAPAIALPKPTPKPEPVLPAYCNPPNPCPYGMTKAQGCVDDFDNTAIFSREFQAAQKCMCDNEHMFDCSENDNDRDKEMDVTRDIENFLVQQLQGGGGGGGHGEIYNKDFTAKKFYIPSSNPYLEGEQLPIAAKKGNHIN